MGETKELNIKNQTYYFLNDMINIKNFQSNLLKIDKKPHKDFDIYYTGYITIKKIGDYENIHSVNNNGNENDNENDNDNDNEK